jgi:hypothetical protein
VSTHLFDPMNVCSDLKRDQASVYTSAWTDGTPSSSEISRSALHNLNVFIPGQESMVIEHLDAATSAPVANVDQGAGSGRVPHSHARAFGRHKSISRPLSPLYLVC